MGLLLLPFRAVDTAGDPMSGAKLKFFAAGTSTPKSSYPTEADAVADTNGATTVTADANGLFEAVYGDNDADYKIRLTDSADVQIWEEDDVPVVKPTVFARQLQAVRSPLDYNGIGDGAQNETTAVQDAINAANTAGTATVDLLGLTWRCDSQITLYSGLRIINGTLDFSNCTDAAYLIIQGTVGTPVALSSNSTEGDATISTASTGTASVGQWLHLGDTDDWDGSANVNQGLLVQVRAIVANTSIGFHGRVPLDIEAAKTGQWTPLTQLSDIVLEDLTITSGSTATSAAILIDVADRVKVKNVKFDKIAEYGIDIRLSTNITIEDCEFGPSNATSSTCIGVRECSRNVTISDCEFRECEYSVDIGGIPTSGVNGACAEITVRGCKSYGAVTVHFNAQVSSIWVNIENNDIYGYDGSSADKGIFVAGAFTRVIRNRLKETHGIAIDYDEDIDISSNTYSKRSSIHIVGNEIYGCTNTTAAIQIQMQDNQIGFAHVDDNHLYNCSGAGFLFGTDWDGTISVRGNSINTLASGKTALHFQSSGSVSYNGAAVSITGNTFELISGRVVFVEGDSGYFTISGNVFQGDDSYNNVDCSPGNGNGHFTVMNNVLIQGADGINAGTTDTAYNAGNVFVSCVDNIAGTWDAISGVGSGGSSETLVETT